MEALQLVSPVLGCIRMSKIGPNSGNRIPDFADERTRAGLFRLLYEDIHLNPLIVRRVEAPPFRVSDTRIDDRYPMHSGRVDVLNEVR